MNTNSTEQRLSELEARVAKLESVNSLTRPARQSLSTEKKVSAKEFLMTKDIRTDMQRTLTLGYYLEHVEGMPSFNVDDLTTVFQAAKEKRPQNINDTVNKNVARGLLMEASEKKDSKKAWTLTTTGEKHVENEINK